MCCNNKQLEQENLTVKRVNRDLQTNINIMKSNKQQLQTSKRSLLEQRDNLSSKLKVMEDNEVKFKKAFHKQLVQNDKKAKESFNKIQSCEQLAQLELKPIELTYQSIQSFFSPQFNRDQITFLLQQIYNLLNGEYYNAQNLIFSIKRYIKLIKEIVTQGYNSKQDHQLIRARQFLSNNFSDFFKELDQLIKLSKQKYSKDKSKILEQSGIDSNNEELKIEIKLQNKITELELQINKLKSQNEKALEENHLFQTITIPRLRDQLNKKQAKEFEEIKDTLHKMDKKFIDKEALLSGLEELKGEIRNIVYSTSDQDMVEIVKAKDLKISSLEKKLALNQAKKLSEWSQETELSYKIVENEINSKNRQIQDLKRSLNYQKDAFQEISSQLVEKQKVISDSFLIKENLTAIEKQNIRLSAELQTAQQRIKDLQKQMKVLQQSGSKQASQKSSQDQQLKDIKMRMKLLLDDNTTQKQKRAVLSVRVTEREGEIQRLKEELGSLSSQNQTLSLQVQQIKSSKEQVAQRNHQLSQQLSVLKKNEKESAQSNALSQQKQSSSLQKQVISMQNQFKKEKQQLQKTITDLKLAKQSLSVSMQRMRKRNQAQLQQKVFAYSNLQLSFNNLQLSKFQLQNQIKLLQKEVKQLKVQIKDKKGLQQYRNTAVEQIQLLKSQLEKEKNRTIALENEVKDLKLLNMKMGQKLKQISSSSNQNYRMRSASFVEHRTLFIGEILEKKKVEKKFLMNAIQTLMKQQIQKTEKLYQFKRDNNINPHTYIDGHSNLVVIVQTEKALIAAYYSGVLQSQAPMTSQALILSLDNKKFYSLKESTGDNRTPKGMVYDQYYIIYGNTQVRIRTGQAKVFSNFGTLSGYFNSKGDKINALLRDGNNNEVDLINYEIHQVHFSQDYTLESIQ